MSDLIHTTQAIVSALVGGGGGLLATAIRITRKFQALTKSVEDVKRKQDDQDRRLDALTKSFHDMEDDIKALARIQDLQELKASIEDLRRKHYVLKDRVDDTERRSRSSRTDLNQKNKDLQSGFKLELLHLKQEIYDKIENAVDEAIKVSKGVEPAHLDEVRRRLLGLESLVDKIRDQFVRSDTFVSFAEDQGRQWNELQRTLGRLEGLMKTSSVSLTSLQTRDRSK